MEVETERHLHLTPLHCKLQSMRLLKLKTYSKTQ